MKPPAQTCVGGFFLLYYNRARGDADEPINPVLVNESRNLSIAPNASFARLIPRSVLFYYALGRAVV